MRFTYLLIDFFSILAPFLFSFYPRPGFYRSWGALFPAIALSGLIFVVWDMYFTQAGIWGFNPTYITGYYIGNLPVEEILFFICIPYACVFTWFKIGSNLKIALSPKAEQIVTSILIIVFTLIGVLHYHQAYTLYGFTAAALLLIIAHYVLKIKWLFKFYITYVILLVPFLIVNGLLTGTVLKSPVVWYNNSQNLAIRILTIPVEDIFYGIALVLFNILLYEYFRTLLHAADKRR